MLKRWDMVAVEVVRRERGLIEKKCKADPR